MLVMVQLVLQVPIAGSLWLFLAGALLYLFSVTALRHLLIGTFTTSMAQFGLLCIPILVILQLLSRLQHTDRKRQPCRSRLQNVMQLGSTTHFVSFAQAVLYRGAGLDIVWRQLLAMTVISGVIFMISGLRFRTGPLSLLSNWAAVDPLI